MLNTINKTSPDPEKVEKKNTLYINQSLSKHSNYYLKFEVIIDSEEDFECIVRIIDELNENNVIEKRRFFNKTSFMFNCIDCTSMKFEEFAEEDLDEVELEEDPCIIFIEYEFPNFKKSEMPNYLDIEIIEFDSKLIDSLNTNPKIKEEIYELVDKYLIDDFKGAINEIGIIGEYIAREFSEKIYNKKSIIFERH